MINALIFDFDGLILDTESPEYNSWKAIYADYGLELPIHLWMSAVGQGYQGFHPLDYLEQQLGQPVDRPALLARHRQQDDAAIAQNPVLPGVEDYLRDAKHHGLKLAIASSSSHRWVDSHLQRLNLYHYFDAIRCADDVQRKKPAPDLFLAALAALNVPAEAAVVLEDSANGITAARAANIYAVAVPNPITRHADLSHADHILPSLASLPLTDLLTHIARQRNGLTEPR